jgi:peptidoglycan/xylan/chitin deacetylase (PgdA/CDA1 family)
MKVVMYHYVQEHSTKFPYFKFYDIENFRKQLDFFQKNFGFVSLSEWVDFIDNGIEPSIKGKVVLTFDDALSCHYKFVYPELLKRGLWGIFYIPCAPYLTGKMLDVHRIHLLCGAFEGLDLIREVKNIVTEEMVPFKKRLEFRNKTYTTQKNDAEILEFKKILNYFISYDFREEVISEISRRMSFNEYESKFYVTEEELIEMAAHGMILGSHSNSHPVMSKLSRDEQLNEIETSFIFLEKLCTVGHKTYCHPYGGFHSFNSQTVELLNELNIDYSFNVDPREILGSDLISCRQFLPRFDCNLFAHGKVS